MIKSIEEGRKEDGNRSIADKIIKRLHDLEMTAENNHGRWGWELLQNAKDSVSGTSNEISVKIKLSKDNLTFSHNGLPFSEKDIRGLINQISSKEVEEGEHSENIGKFGTGFLTTHLLSKKVDVSGFLKTSDNKHYQFSLMIDRSAKKTNALVDQINESWESFHRSTDTNDLPYYDENCNVTSFKYLTETEKQFNVAKLGLKEISDLLPFVMVFVPKIKQILIEDENGAQLKFEKGESTYGNSLITIKKTDDGEIDLIKLLVAEEDDVKISIMVNENNDKYEIKNLNNVPKIFCDFPLIGTENFYFPVVVNCPRFNPLTERDGIWLNGDDKIEVEQNRVILHKAVELYKNLLKKITKLNFCKFYNICNTRMPIVDEKYIDAKWYKENVQALLRDIISESEVVESQNGNIIVNDVFFPDKDLNHADREMIWKYSNDLKTNNLPLRELIHDWADVVWSGYNKLDINDLAGDIQNKKNVDQLSVILDEENVFDWLNACFSFMYERGGQPIFNNYSIMPNQEGEFKKRKELSLDDIGEDSLKEIAKVLAKNYYKELINDKIIFEDINGKISLQNVAIFITNAIEKGVIIEENKKLAIRKLIEWFDYNKTSGQMHFSALYNKKEKLLVDTIDDKDNLYSILKSKTSLATLAQVVKAVEHDPQIINIIKKRQENIKEEKDRNFFGEKIELILSNKLKSQGFTVKKTVYGQDFIISMSKGQNLYKLEIKSTAQRKYVFMTPYQGITAAQNAENYALCVVVLDSQQVKEDDIIKNSKFVTDIGYKISNKVEQIQNLKENKNKIFNDKGDIDLYYDNDLEFRYRISNNLWSLGKSFDEFVTYIVSK